ncbi:DUF3785 domain-containing protein [Clostridium sp. CTA-19]
MEYKFKYDNEEYVLSENNCEDFLNDEENEVLDFSIEKTIELLNNKDDAYWDVEYYRRACQFCFKGKEENEKVFKFLEYHFYVFTKDSKYVMSNISKEYENTSYNKLEKAKKVDNSYIVNVILCPYCKKYSIEIEQCDM